MAVSLDLMTTLIAFGGEASVEAVRALCARVSDSGRLAAAIRRLEKRGRITVRGSGPIDGRILRLTEAGRSVLHGGIDPLALWSRPWDGAWRIVAFDIPDPEVALRARLRRQLHELRFGWLQNSVWISPDPVGSFHAQLKGSEVIPESLCVFEAKPAGGESADALVRSAWDFDALDQGFSDYLGVLDLRPRLRCRREALLKWLQSEQAAWRHVVRLDPFLPRALVPPGYRGETVWRRRMQAFGDLRKLLV